MLERVHSFNVFERRDLPPSVWKFRARQKPWDRWEEEKGLQGEIHRRQRHLTLRQVRNVSGELDVLDAGCGTGKIACELAALPRVRRITAVDINPLALAIAREKGQHCKGKGKLNFSLARLDEIYFLEASFDVVVCIDVFSELSDVPRILANMHRWLKPGGMLVGNFVAEEVFVRYAVERHGIVKRQLMALRHYLGISFSFTPLTYPLYDYFGEKGYTRLMPYREHEIRAVLAPHFDLLHRDTGLYHWFAAQRKA